MFDFESFVKPIERLTARLESLEKAVDRIRETIEKGLTSAPPHPIDEEGAMGGICAKVGKNLDKKVLNFLAQVLEGAKNPPRKEE